MSEVVTDKALTELQVVEFLEKLAGGDATPGGGSAAALAGAMSAALVTMVGGLSKGKKGMEDVAETLDILVEQGKQMTQSLAAAVDEDAAAYDGVMQAFGLQKGTDSEKAERSKAIQAAMVEAAEVPLAVATECLAAAELALVALEKGNPNAATDGAVGLLLALTGLEGAALNVVVNLESIKDAEYVNAKRAEVADLLSASNDLRAELWQQMRARFASLPS